MSVHSKRTEGYLLIDNSASGGGKRESAVRSCAHCEKQIFPNPFRTRPSNYCRKCDDYVCDNIACNLECKPIEMVFEEIQRRHGRATII